MTNRQKLLQAIPTIERYTTAVLAVVCTLAIRLALAPMLGDRAPYMLFILMVFVVKSLWGRGPGLLASLLGGIGAWYFIVEPQFTFQFRSPTDTLNLAGYFAVGAAISYLGEASSLSPASDTAGSRPVRPHVVRQTAVLAGAAVVLVGMVLLLHRDFARTQDAETWVAHTYQVIDSAQSLRSVIENAGVGERRFLLTGNARDLADYRAAVAAVPSRVKELKDLTTDNANQQARCVEIKKLTDDRLRTLGRGLELRTSVSADAGLAAIRSNDGLQSMDNLRSVLDAVIRDEHDLLVKRTAQAETQALRGRWVLGLGSGALIILLVFASMVIERETVRREELTEALRHHAGLLEQAHDSLIICRLGGAIGYWNRGAETLFGYTREEAVGRFSQELLQTYHPSGMSQIDAILERDGRWKGELTQTGKDGRKLIVEAQWTLAVDARGNRVVLEAHRDISARKQAEEHLRASEAILRSFFDSPGMMRGMVELIEGRIIHLSCNEAAAELYGVDRECITGKSATQAGASDEVVRTWLALYQEAQNTGRPVSGEYARLDAQGREKWLLATASYMGIGPSGNPRFAYTILDLTERRRATEALRESESRLRRLGDNLPDGAIYTYRLDAGGQPHVDFISAGIERLTGVPAAEFMSDAATVNKAVLPEDRKRLHTAIGLSRAHLTRFEVEVRHKHRVTGEIRWTLLRSTPSRSPDGSTLWDGIELDITDRKRAEADRLLLATAIEQAAETVVITGRDAKIQYVNPAFTLTTGYTRIKAYGRNPRILKSGQHDAKFYQELWANLSDGKLWRGEFTNRRKDGTLYIEDATIAPVRDASGEITNYIAIKSDVTERKRAELALRESDMMLRFFVRHAPAAIAMLDRDMRYLVVSQRWMSDFRLGERDLRGLSHYDVCPEIPERWKEVHQRCLAGAVESCREDPFPRLDGRVDWLSWEIRPWRKIDASIGGIIIFCEVITERKQAEDALRESRAKLEAALASMTEAVFISDAEGQFVHFNDAFVTFHRFRGRGECAKAHAEYPEIFDMFLPDGTLAPVNMWAVPRALRGESTTNAEYRLRRKDTGESWIGSYSFGPVRDEAGAIIGAVVVGRDITDRKRAEEALEESELRYRRLFERSESGLALHEAVFDAHGNSTGYRCLDINPACERIMGVTRRQVQGRYAHEVLPELGEYYKKLFGQLAATGGPVTFEEYSRTLRKYFAGSAYSPGPNQFAISFMDITERKRAEREVRLLNIELEGRVRSRTAELEAANRELEAFAHSVSHDLRAPLRGIDGWSQALVEDYGERLDPQGHNYLQRVRSEAQRMGRLIDDLLQLSRMSRSELVSQTVDLTSLGETIAARLREANPSRSIQLIVAPELKCSGDARLLEAALTNLLDNAVKFTGPRNPARVEFGQTECEGNRAFFVRDNGVGFDMAYAKMLFAPFQRLHKATEFPGTGIGLATVQRVIHRHRGRIWAESQLGAGTTIYFTVGES